MLNGFVLGGKCCNNHPTWKRPLPALHINIQNFSLLWWLKYQITGGGGKYVIVNIFILGSVIYHFAFLFINICCRLSVNIWFWCEKAIFHNRMKAIIIGWFMLRWIWRVRQNRSTNIRIFHVLFLLYAVLSQNGGQHLFPIDERSRFPTKRLWTRCSWWTYKCAFNISLRFKNSKWIIHRWFRYTHSIIFAL